MCNKALVEHKNSSSISALAPAHEFVYNKKNTREDEFGWPVLGSIAGDNNKIWVLSKWVATQTDK